MNTNDPTDLLRRILGEEGEALMHMVHTETSDAALLKSAGIDTEAMLARAQIQISRAAKLSQAGINPPVPLEELSEDAFKALDIPTLQKYLVAGGVDVNRLMVRTQELLDQHATQHATTPNEKAKPKKTLAEKLFGMWPKAPGGPIWGVAVSAMVLVAVGVGVWRLAPQAPIIAPAPDVRELAVSLDPEPSIPVATVRSVTPAPVLMSAPSLEQALSTPIEPAALADSASVDEIDQAVAIASNAPTRTNESPTWAVTQQASEPAPKQKVEFVFQPGDTFSHGMARSGLPTQLSNALAERVGSNFHPGDKLIIFFENDEFEQLVVIRRKKQPITVTADLKTVTAPAETIAVIDINGAIESSLYAALEKALDANTAQRITWLLQSRAVPLTTLPKGTTFSVQIEKVSDANGETLGFGEIKSVHLDAGKRGKFAV